MSQVTFDSTDNPDVQASQQEAEAKSLAIGEKIINEHQEAETAVYEKARQDAESQIRYANKFRSAEDLEKAYIELEKKLGQPKTETLENDDQDEQPDEPAEVRDEERQQGDEHEREPVEETPKLSREEEEAILDQVGGLDFYNQALKWAATGLSQEEIAAYDAIIGSGDKGAVQFAVKSLVQQFKAAGDYDGSPVSGKAVKGQGVKPFRSQAELARAIGNSKYQTDPAYRIDVEQRLAASGDLL